MPQKDVGYLIKVINDKLKANADADLKQYHLTFAQSRVLAFLINSDGSATQKEIEVFLEVSHPTVAGIVSRMEQNGYLATRTDDNDKRNKIVSLTPRAKKIIADIEMHINKNEQTLLAPLSAEDAKRLKELLFTVYNHLE